jgi:hypothetical protein
MVIRKYTKKRRRRSLRKLRGGTRTPEESTPEESTPLSPRQLDLAEVLSRKQALRVHDNLFRNLRSLQSYHNPEHARYAKLTASPPPMTPRKRQEHAEYLAMRRAPPYERRELFRAMLERRARRFAQDRRKKPTGLEARRGLVDRNVDLYFRDLARQLDDAILNLRPTKSPQRRSASRSTRRRSATRSTRRRSATLSPPPPSPRLPLRSTRSRSATRSTPPSTVRSASRTAWGRSATRSTPPSTVRSASRTAWGGRRRTRSTPPSTVRSASRTAWGGRRRTRHKR